MLPTAGTADPERGAGSLARSGDPLLGHHSHDLPGAVHHILRHVPLHISGTSISFGVG